MLVKIGTTYFLSVLILSRFESLARGIMGNSFSSSWFVIMNLIVVGGNMGKKKLFYLHYAFQTAMYAVWREHVENLIPVNVLKKLADKGVKNKLSLLRFKGVNGTEGAFQIWFGTRL